MVKDGDLIFLLSNKKPPSLIIKNFSAIRTNNDGLIILSFDAKKLNYYDNLKDGEIFNPRIFLADLPNKKEIEFLHRGIAGRNFERKFRLADTIKVTDANYENGLLHIFLEREIPEHQKPRKIEINSKIN